MYNTQPKPKSFFRVSAQSYISQAKTPKTNFAPPHTQREGESEVERNGDLQGY